MNYAVNGESLESLDAYRSDSALGLDWGSVFVLPVWLRCWWEVFGEGNEMLVCTVREGDSVIGIAPLRARDGEARFIGDIDVCDYADFVVVPGWERDFFGALLDHLVEKGITRLDLALVRPDASVFRGLEEAAGERGYGFVRTQEDVTVEMEMPGDWEAYLAGLSSKQRHEVRRKMRRMAEYGDVDFGFIEGVEEVTSALDGFFRMFTESRRDKSEFLTNKVELFFRLMTAAMAREGLLRMGVLRLNREPIAEIVCFDYGDRVYLYNSGYDPEHTAMSAGLLSKVYAIRDSIEKGRGTFDFLKGDETYKQQLGGREVPLYRCRVDIRG
jgi:CelD/BcsL family acetyltransferase involved in cellulose biosynthesis